ncbi:MAG TPA: hypothetical protein PLM81_00765 [Ginsengibacter sp.]|mgnify:CR=1 FL=1|nr:hypothetical protein [Ginsengibacter sp.]HRP16979.1 hypothetical protein [Ginsengibacter sp.]
MRKFILSFAILAFTLGAKAQDTKLSVGASIGFPTTSGMSFAYGADLQADFGVAESAAITASAGYLNYSWKGGGNSGFIPLLAGGKFGFGESGMYGHAQIGYGFASRGGGGAFAYAPSLGYNVSDNLDLAVKYLAFSKNGFTNGSVNLRVAYKF